MLIFTERKFFCGVCYLWCRHEGMFCWLSTVSCCRSPGCSLPDKMIRTVLDRHGSVWRCSWHESVRDTVMWLEKQNWAWPQNVVDTVAWKVRFHCSWVFCCGAFSLSFCPHHAGSFESSIRGSAEYRESSDLELRLPPSVLSVTLALLQAR